MPELQHFFIPAIIGLEQRNQFIRVHFPLDAEVLVERFTKVPSCVLVITTENCFIFWDEIKFMIQPRDDGVSLMIDSIHSIELDVDI